jgi:ubiquinone/menaquinone biosynthesis C-methylase UbiE
VPADARVLEIGCGEGIGLRALRRRVRLVVGVDLCSGPVIGAAEQLPFAGGSFDLVVDFGVVQHLPEGAAQALGEISRVLRPGGRYACETAAAQVLAHPRHVTRGPLEWPVALAPERHLGLWQVRRRA